MELGDTLAFPPKPYSAEVAVHGSWRRRAEVQKERCHGMVAQNVCYELVCRGVWLKKSHLHSQKLLDWIGVLKTHRGPRASCVPVGAACQHPPCQYSKAELCWCGEYVSGASYISSVQAARLLMAEMQDFSNAVQGSWAFQKNRQCRPVLFSLSEKWCGGNINQQVRILFPNWKMKFAFWFPSLNFMCTLLIFFFFHYCYNLIMGFTSTLWKKSNQTKTPHQCFRYDIQ